jgi:plastocyanin
MDRRRAIMGLAVAFVLLGAACSSKSPPSTLPSPTTQPPTTQPPTTQPPASPSASAGFTLQQGAGGALVFSPATFTVKEGTTVAVNNVSQLPHTFTVTGQNIDITNNGGQSQTVTIDLSPGHYDFICRFHVSSGMKGSFTVTG